MRMMVGIAAATLLASPVAAQSLDARQQVERAVQHMGGEQALRNLRTVRYSSQTVLYNLGQSVAEHAPLSFNIRGSTVRYDFVNGRMVVHSEFPSNAPAGLTFRQRFIQSRAGGMGDNNGNFQPLPAILPVGLRTFPSYLLLTALDPATRLERAGAGVRMMGTQDTATLFFDQAGRLAYSETVTDDPMLGDRTTRTTFRNWIMAGRDGLWLPGRVDVTANGTMTQANNLVAFTPNEDFPDSLFAIPDSIARRSLALGAPGQQPVTVRMDSLAPGVYHMTGGSHHSLAVVQGNQTVVIEAPQSNARMNAVLDTLASRLPRSPVRMVVNSHDHWDHAGGVRGALAARVTVVAHATSMSQLRETARARRTIVPDGVERLRHDFRAVNDSLVIGSGASALVLYHLPTVHDDGMLVGYVPAARILFVVDVLPSQSRQSNREVVDLVNSRGLQVERLVPSHGAILPWSRIVELAQ